MYCTGRQSSLASCHTLTNSQDAAWVESDRNIHNTPNHNVKENNVMIVMYANQYQRQLEGLREHKPPLILVLPTGKYN